MHFFQNFKHKNYTHGMLALCSLHNRELLLNKILGNILVTSAVGDTFKVISMNKFPMFKPKKGYLFLFILLLFPKNIIIGIF